MADLGDCGWMARSNKRQGITSLAVTPAVWPDVSRNKLTIGKVGFAPARGIQNDHLHVVVDIPVAGTPYITVLQEGQWKGGTRASGGHAYFYDLDDGVYYALDADGGGVWRVTVAGESVTVEELSGSALPGTLYLDNGRLKASLDGSPIAGGRLVAIQT